MGGIRTTIFSTLKVRLLPRFDQSFAALQDSEERGLLDQTLVVCMENSAEGRG